MTKAGKVSALWEDNAAEYYVFFCVLQEKHEIEEIQKFHKMLSYIFGNIAHSWLAS